MENTAGLRRTGGNENTGVIKLIALAFMIVDHVGVVFFPGIREMRLLGRIAFPLYVWCLCVGVEYTRNHWKYALRLLLVGALTQPCFMQALGHGWMEWNVYATLLVGLLAIIAIRENKWGSRYWGPVLALAASCAVQMDYGWQGVTFILLMYACRKQKSAVAAVMIAFSLFYGHYTFSLTSYFGIAPLKEISFLPLAKSLLADINRVQFWQILALPVMLWPSKKRWKLPRWATYAAYPGHLLIIGVIRHWDEIMALLGR